VDFRQDQAGDWAAVLDCWHGRHFRHDPPWVENPWVLSATGRASRIGKSTDCPKCEWIELPDGLRLERTTAEWNQDTIPAGIRRTHRVASGVWGRLRVLDGAVNFVFDDQFPGACDQPVSAGSHQLIPPDRPHHLVVGEPVRLVVDFLVRADHLG